MIGRERFLSDISLVQGLVAGLAAVACFHAAFAWDTVASLIAVYLYGLYRLSYLGTARRAFYAGLLVGLGCFAPQLHFFWSIFGPGAIALWIVLAFWDGLFVWLVRQCREEFGLGAAACLAPFLWTGLEYFRSELYYLRFSWLSAGYAFSGEPNLGFLKVTGIYGAGFLLVAGVAGLSLAPAKVRLILGSSLLAAFQVSLPWWGTKTEPSVVPAFVRVAGIQSEFPAAFEVPQLLDHLLKKQPKAKLLVMSEYTFDGPVPAPVRDWCRRHERYLVVGGKQFVGPHQFFNTVFVVSPEGKIVFRQAKSVPIQFFQDGRPALSQRVWDSPWGKIGICVCYDMSYTRVVDRLVRMGARLLLVPTMDVEWWGTHEHRLHARVAPARAAELSLPVFRLASSGISQMVSAQGHCLAQASFPGEKATLGGVVGLAGEGQLGWDRWMAPLSVGAVAGILVTLLVRRLRTPLKNCLIWAPGLQLSSISAPESPRL
jgi:apolipoprotein N-acyltransferase